MGTDGAGTPQSTGRAWFLVVVAALGYFVDIYDLLLFGIVRKPSLVEIGVPEAQLLDAGAVLLQAQMSGLLIGGIVWGILGDKRGRLSVLFASIALYSLANIANGFVHDVDAYAALRFVAGVGLAGELGAGITIVSETIPRQLRSVATAVVASVGIFGAVVAAAVGAVGGWRTAYFVGGGLGIALLLLRVGAFESGLYAKVKNAAVARGNFFALFASRSRIKRYLTVIFAGVPIWYAVGILVTFSPEIGTAMGLPVAPSAATAIQVCYAGLVVGDLGSGLLSHFMRSRKRVLVAFTALTALAVVTFFALGGQSLEVFYGCCVFIGVATGYWAVFMASAAEQFGTNLRATATTTTPNFVRGMTVPLTAMLTILRPRLGVVESAAAIGVVVFLAAAVALFFLEETFGKELDFVE
ncbi:MAG TPA: MFS transporter [Myxococcota bacterium]|jgi:MFS family permease